MPPPLAFPVWMTSSSHMAGGDASPEPGNDCLSCHASTSENFPPPVLIWVCTPVSRLRLKKLGEPYMHTAPWLQTWSNGTSGHCNAFCAVSFAGAQSNVDVGRHRSAVSNVTRAAGSVP